MIFNITNITEHNEGQTSRGPLSVLSLLKQIEHASWAAYFITSESVHFVVVFPHFLTVCFIRGLHG